MFEHDIGNHYKLLGHILELEEIFTVNLRNRCKLSCGSGCCAYNSGIKIECRLDDLDEMELVKEADKTSKIDWYLGDTAEIKEGWDRAGDYLQVLAPAVFLGQWWVPVDDPKNSEKGPTYHTEAGLRKVE